MGGPFPDLEGTGALMLALGLRRSIFLYTISHRSSVSRRSGTERRSHRSKTPERAARATYWTICVNDEVVQLAALHLRAARPSMPLCC